MSEASEKKTPKNPMAAKYKLLICMWAVYLVITAIAMITNQPESITIMLLKEVSVGAGFATIVIVLFG
jgi:hypothetical protein